MSPPKLISRDCWTRQEGILRVAVPNEQPEIVQICGFFNASFGQSVRLFGELREPVIEQFELSDKIDLKLREAMNELLQQEVGVGAMTASLLKQIVVSLVRRSLRSSRRWTRANTRYSLTSRSPVLLPNGGATRSRPFSPKLGTSAGLSRSAFMARIFSNIFGQSPMVILRDLRMRQAAIDLTTTTMSIDVVAQDAGYESRSSFVRAFRKAYNRDPSDYRRVAKDGKAQRGYLRTRCDPKEERAARHGTTLALRDTERPPNSGASRQHPERPLIEMRLPRCNEIDRIKRDRLQHFVSSWLQRRRNPRKHHQRSVRD